MNALAKEIEALIAAGHFDPKVAEQFMTRLAEGHLVRQENPASHVSTYFLPYNPANQTVLLVAHKKSGLWLAPGGHVEPNETLWQTVNREIREELGVPDHFPASPKPFLLTIVDIPPRPNGHCRRHYDVWFLMPTDGKNFAIDPGEFHETRWVDKAGALDLLTDASNIEAINAVLPAQISDTVISVST